MKNDEPLEILLADEDDNFLFIEALKELPITTNLTILENGEHVINHFIDNHNKLPAILFLDYNMPCKNGLECLTTEIKSIIQNQNLPVIITSTFISDITIDILYQKGAYYYMRKTNFSELVGNLLKISILIQEDRFFRPVREQFVLSL